MIKVYLKIFLLSIIQLQAQQTICAYCGKPIEKSYIVYEGKTYHESCYKSHIQLRCAKCGQPIEGKFIEKNGKAYHEKCYMQSVALKCDLCNKPITGTYITDYWGNNYHIEHEYKEARCDYCGRFISGKLTHGGSKYNDGRVICGLCSVTAIRSISQAEAILSNVKYLLQNFGILINVDEIELKLVDKNELKKVSSENANLSDPRGFAKYSYWKTGDEITKREFTIYILDGMPRKEFEAVAAHELMHVWQYINSPGKLQSLLAEGSAEYVSYLYMNNQYDEYSKFIVYKIETNNDNTYGEGFRRIKKYVDEKGFNTLLDYLRRSNSFPSGY